MKPANFVLDLLRTYGRRGTSARQIMSAAGIFAFSENLVRVTLSRLVSRGLIENFERGSYRLAVSSDPVSSFAEEWRKGEARRRSWPEPVFVLLGLDSPGERDQWVLSAMGFRQLGNELWSRPDNLAVSGDALEDRLHELGLNKGAVIAFDARLATAAQSRMFEHYNPDALQQRYQQLIEQLQRSATNLTSMDQQDAMRECFTLGGEAIQVLAKDPLLPEEIMPADARQALWQTMIDYDELGRGIWSGIPDTLPVSVASNF